MKNLKYDFSKESLGQEKHFKHIFGIGVGWRFEKIWIQIKNNRDSADIIGSYKKKSVLENFLINDQMSMV